MTKIITKDGKVIDKTSELKVDDEMREKIRPKIGYLIIQEFPLSNTSYVIGYKPYGKIWFDYEEVLAQYFILMEDFQRDLDNNEIQNSKVPRIVKIFIMDEENVIGHDLSLNRRYDEEDEGENIINININAEYLSDKNSDNDSGNDNQDNDSDNGSDEN